LDWIVWSLDIFISPQQNHYSVSLFHQLSICVCWITDSFEDFMLKDKIIQKYSLVSFIKCCSLIYFWVKISTFLHTINLVSKLPWYFDIIECVFLVDVLLLLQLNSMWIRF
jgi:hypothetical protein